MSGTKEYSVTAANNSLAPPDGAPEGMDANKVNNTMRQTMANIKAGPYVVADLIALKALDSTLQVTGNQIALTGLVTAGTHGGLFRYDSSSSATSDDINVVTPTDTLGRWLRVVLNDQGLDTTDSAVFVEVDAIIGANTPAAVTATTVNAANTGTFGGRVQGIGVNRFAKADSTPAGTANSVFDDAVFGSTDTVNTGISILGSGQVGLAFGNAGDTDRGQLRYQIGSDTMQSIVGGSIEFSLTTTAATFASDVIVGSTGGSSSGRFTLSFDGGLENGMYLRNTDTGASSDTLFNFDRDGTLTGNIRHTDVATAYNTSSDERMKSPFREISIDKAWAEFDKLYSTIGEFDWIVGAAKTKNVLGFGAQKALGLGLDLASKGAGPSDAKLGDVYGTKDHPDKLADVDHLDLYETKYHDAEIGLIPILDGKGEETGKFFKGIVKPAYKEEVLVKKAWTEKDVIIKKAWTEDLIVTAAGVDQSKPMAMVLVLIKDLRDKLEAK